MMQRSPARPPIHVAPVRRPPPKTGKGISISSMEITQILVSLVTLALAFTYFFGIEDTGIIIGVIAGVIFHELGHKFVAQSLGFHSEYRLWAIGLVLVLAFALISKGKFIFAAPGFVVTEGYATLREKGMVSLAAPTMNIFLTIFFLILPVPWGKSAAMVNAFLAAFNLLPISPLDGKTVRDWSETVWVSFFVTAVVLGLFFLL
jgi:Zn-dependent protease